MKTPESQSDYIKQLRKENEALLSDLQSCQAGHEALVKERDQLKLHVQVLREALLDIKDGESSARHDTKCRCMICVAANDLSTTPSLNDYVPRSVADNLANAICKHVHYEMGNEAFHKINVALANYGISTQKEQTK